MIDDDDDDDDDNDNMTIALLTIIEAITVSLFSFIITIHRHCLRPCRCYPVPPFVLFL